jgi:Flp pilus assembly protein TadD
VRIAKAGVPFEYAAAKGDGDITALEKELTGAIASAPSFGPAFLELGIARMLLGDADGALAALRRARELLPGAVEARSELGLALLGTGDAPDAVVELSCAIQLDPQDAKRHGNLGTALMMAGRTPEAIAEYEANVRLDDDDARAHANLGTALAGVGGQNERALQELTRAVALDPQHASYHSSLGYTLQEAGQTERAIAEYRRALVLDPTLVSALLNLASALACDLKTRGDARSLVVRAQALAPEDPRVKTALDDLDALQKNPCLRNKGSPDVAGEGPQKSTGLPP